MEFRKEKTALVNQAWDVLGNEQKRREYDVRRGDVPAPASRSVQRGAPAPTRPRTGPVPSGPWERERGTKPVQPRVRDEVPKGWPFPEMPDRERPERRQSPPGRGKDYDIHGGPRDDEFYGPLKDDGFDNRPLDDGFHRRPTDDGFHGTPRPGDGFRGTPTPNDGRDRPPESRDAVPQPTRRQMQDDLDRSDARSGGPPSDSGRSRRDRPVGGNVDISPTPPSTGPQYADSARPASVAEQIVRRPSEAYRGKTPKPVAPQREQARPARA